MRKAAFFAAAALVAGCTGILGSFDVSGNGVTPGNDAGNDALGNPDGTDGTDGSTLDGGDEAGVPPKGDFLFTGLAGQNGIHDGTSTVDAMGNIYVATNVTAPVTINGVVHSPANGAGISVIFIKLDPTGQTVLWSVDFDSDAYLYVNAMSTDAAGNLYFAASLQGASMTFGATTVTNPNAGASQLAGVVGSLKAQDGTARWAITPDFTSTTSDQCYGVDARGPAGEVAATCSYGGSVHFVSIDGPYLNAVSSGADDTVVAMLDSGGGKAIWVKNIAGAGFERTRGLARDNAGNVYIQGASASASISDGTYTLTKPAGAAVMAFMLKINDVQPHAISLGKAFGSSTGTVQDGQVAALSDGTVVSCFGWDGTIDFGKGPITSLGNSANQDAVAIGIDGTTAATSWVLPWGGVYREDCLGIAADTEGYALIASERSSAGVTIGGKPLADPPPRDGSGSRTGDAIKVDAKGNVAWAFTIESTDTGATEAVSSISVMPSTNRVVYSGLYRGHADLGSGQLTTSENNGAFNSFYVTARTR